jgi:type VI secretion system lysozyme-like protein
MAKNQLLKEPKSFLGAKPLLFDRLIDDHSNESDDSSDLIFLSFNQIKESIEIELTRLLNTRAKSLGLDEDGASYGGPSFYGIPDFNTYDASNTQDWPAIGQTIYDAIDRFEPRLKNFTVTVNEFDSLSQTLKVMISGSLNVKKVEGEVTFAIAVECSKNK